MVAKFEQFSTVAGVLAPGYINRSDIEKYDLALLEGKNWFVDYRGGLSSRPGWEHCDFLMEDGKAINAWAFQYGYDIANTYLVIFGDGYIRFMQDGAYVLETSKNATAVAGATVTSAAHAYSNDEWVKVAGSGIAAADGMCCVVSAAAANTLQLKDMFGNVIDFTGATTPFTMSRIYTVPTTFTSAEVRNIRCQQIRNVLRISSLRRNFLPYDLTRTSSTSWALTPIETENNVAIPTGLTGAASSAGDKCVIFAVTAVDRDGQESLPSASFILNNIVDYTSSAGTVTITWDSQSNIKYFNVYRSIIGHEDDLTLAQELGYLGRAYGSQFHDNNIIPDFTKQPPQYTNPFANSAIEFINVTNGGAGYDATTTITITDGTGTGATAVPVVYGGEILSVIVKTGGQGYSATPTITASVGAGATFDVEFTESDGNYPALGVTFQQRQVWVSTKNAPLDVIASRPGQFNNFDNGGIVTDSDSYRYEIDSEVVTGIKHVLPTRTGLLVATEAGMWQLTGSNGVVSATDALAERQSYNGVNDAGLLQINEDIILIDNEGTAARLLTYSDYSKNYQSTDISILSNHYFDSENDVRSWNYFSGPHRLVLAIRSDGSVLSGCVVKEHNIFAWTDWATQGFVKSVHRVKEDTRDSAYFIVERVIQGQTRKFIERMAPRKIIDVEDYVGLDAALSLPATYPLANVTPSALTGNITLEADAAIFSVADVGKVFRGGGGEGTVIAYIDSTHVTITIDDDITFVIPETTTPYQIKDSDWTLDTPVSSVSGLWHLEGCTVNALLDGDVYTGLVVANGAVELPVPVTRAVIGLPFVCFGRSVVPASTKQTITDARKIVKAVAVWQNETRGLELGARRTKLYEVKERTDEDYGDVTDLQSNLAFMYVDSNWLTDASFYFRQSNPLPASLLGWVLSTEIGDDGD